MTRRDIHGLMLAAALALAAGACAPLPPPATTPAPASRVARGTPVPVDTAHVEAPVPATPAPTAAPVDSGPSREALEVLETIAEPVPGSTSTPTQAEPESTGPDIPVPEPTRPLGERPGEAGLALPDSIMSGSPGPSGGPGQEAPPQAAPGAQPSPPVTAPSAAVHPDSCWRVQVAAPLEREEAEQKRSAAESLLLVPMEIEEVEGRYKVRSRGCLDREGAERLKQRAEESGFAGAFLVRGGSP